MSARPSPSVLSRVVALAHELPETSLQAFAACLDDADLADDPAGARALSTLSSPTTRRRASELLDRWSADDPGGSLRTLSAALRAAHATDAWHREHQHLELVWTGPSPAGSALRRTDQALLELVRAARDSLLIVSFAAYRVPTVHEALLAAAARGTRLDFLFELPDTGKVGYDPVAVLGPELAAASTLWHWPVAERPLDERGRHGTLHAKLALADERRLLVSSANFTGDALFLNMELGVMIEGGQLPRDVAAHFAALVREGTLRRV